MSTRRHSNRSVCRYAASTLFFTVGESYDGSRPKTRRRAAARKRAHLRQVDLKVALGDRYDQSMISHLESGHSVLLLDGAVKAARELGVSLDYLVGLTDAPTPSAELSITEITPEIRQISGGRPVPVCPLPTATDSGALDSDEDVKGCGYFRHEWLSRQGLVAERCSIISMTGESIKLTLPDGCMILVDHNRKRRLRWHISMVRKSDGLAIKRVVKDDSGHWQLVSDHPAWKSEPLDLLCRLDIFLRYGNRS